MVWLLDLRFDMSVYTGGPGSRKGCIVDDLIMAYDLKHICTEQILHHELPKKLAGVTKIENVNGVKEVLEVRNGFGLYHDFCYHV